MKTKIGAVILAIFLCSGVCYALSEQEQMNKIIGLVEQEKYQEALGAADELVVQFPESIKAKGLKVHILGLKGDFEIAKQQAQKLISSCPQPITDDEKDAVVMAHSTISNIYVKQGRIMDAIKETEAALKIKPDSEILLWLAAVTYSQVGMYEKAREKANRLIEIGGKGESKGIMAGYARQLLQKIESSTSPVPK